MRAQKIRQNSVTWLDWHGCYEESNKPYYVPDAFRHPAKMSIALCRRIFKFMEENRMLKPDDIVLDPFGGIGTTGLIGVERGFRCVLVELEEKFVKLTVENIEKNRRLFELWKRKSPIVIQGDSRKLTELIEANIDSIITSSPYGTTKSGGAKGIAVRGYNNPKKRKGKYDKVGKRAYTQEHFSPNNISNLPDGKIDSVITSPAYSNTSAGAGGLNIKPPKKAGQQSGRSPKSPSQDTNQRYGNTNGQIAKLKDTGIDAVVGSPPYANQSGEKRFKNKEDKHRFLEGQRKSHRGRSEKALSKMIDGWEGVPETQGQIGRMKEGNIDAAITSPPFEDSISSDNPKKRGGLFRDPKRSKDKNLTGEYGNTEGQIGKQKGETYWQAMKSVYLECQRVLKKGGWVAIVVKDFVRKGQRIPLCDNTVKLLEFLGFEVHYRARAWLVKETKHTDLFLGEVTIKKERKGFFRRLQEQRGSPRIDWEEVIFARKA
jgi:DNA modification methylase